MPLAADCSSTPVWTSPSRRMRCPDARAVEELGDVVLEHACPDPRLDVVAAARLEDHRVDPRDVEQVPERQPGRAGADDPDLGAGHGRRAALEQRRLALPHADAHRRQAVAAAPPPELVEQRHDEPRAAHPERMAERDRAAVDVHPLLVDPELAEHGERLRRERLVQLDEVERRRRSTPVAVEQLPHGRDRADPHHARVDAGDRGADERAERLDAEVARALLARDHERGGAVVDAARVSCRDGAALAEGRLRAPRASRRVVSGRGCSSASSSPAGTSSSAKRPAAWAAAQRCCERSANASWSSRVTPSARRRSRPSRPSTRREQRLVAARSGTASRASCRRPSGRRARTARRASPSRAARGSSTRRRLRRTGRRRRR